MTCDNVRQMFEVYFKLFNKLHILFIYFYLNRKNKINMNNLQDMW